MTTQIPAINSISQKTQDAVFFDQGSDQTYITKSLAQKLGLQVNRAFLSTIHAFMDGEPEGREVEVWEVEFDLLLRDGSTLHIVEESVDDFAAPMPTVHGRSRAVAHIIANPELPVPIAFETPQILIGTDYLNEFDIIRRRKPLANGFYVYDSRVGPLLNGKGAVAGSIRGPQKESRSIAIDSVTPTDKAQNGATETAPHTSPKSSTADALLAALTSLSSLEALGIKSSECVDDSEEVLAKHQETLQRTEDGRYETGLPWLSFVHEELQSTQEPYKSKKSVVLPTNYRPALARLNSIRRQHSSNPMVMDTYHGTIMNYIARGIVDIASRDSQKD
ncbi:Zinc knuckle family protein [Aphelenchoides avenae]|nr:Zinc knuckle family protein [Aphelenchus avenae]KAH7703194.1 Zinc knuckle family protein [Aphelenchus avenae]